VVVTRYRGTRREIVMARARKKKSAAPRKRRAKRSKPRAEQSQSNWQAGAGILALAIVIGAGAYLFATNDNARSTVANFVERIEVPQAVKDIPEKVKNNLPEMPAITQSDSDGKPGSAPAQ
jgi:type IV secretory pathway VirB10-like protein